MDNVTVTQPVAVNTWKLETNQNREKYVYSIINLERALRRGLDPNTLNARKVGQGCQNIAYLYTLSTGTRVIIKTLVGGWNDGKKRPPRAIKNFGARYALTTRAGQWIIQEAVEVMSKSQQYRDRKGEAYENWQRMYYACIGDLHEHNVGIDTKGQLVVFDW